MIITNVQFCQGYLHGALYEARKVDSDNALVSNDSPHEGMLFSCFGLFKNLLPISKQECKAFWT